MLLYDSFSCGLWNDVASVNRPVNKANEERVKQVIPGFKEIVSEFVKESVDPSVIPVREIFPRWVYFHEICATSSELRVKQLLLLVKSWKNENVINELNDETFISLENCLVIIIHLNYHGKGILREDETFLRDFSKLSYERNMNH